MLTVLQFVASCKCMRRAEVGRILYQTGMFVFLRQQKINWNLVQLHPERAMGSLFENPRWKQNNIDLFPPPTKHSIQCSFEGGILVTRFFCHYSDIILSSYYKSLKAHTCSWQSSSTESKYSRLLHEIPLACLSFIVSSDILSHLVDCSLWSWLIFSENFAAGVSREKQ